LSARDWIQFLLLLTWWTSAGSCTSYT